MSRFCEGFYCSPKITAFVVAFFNMMIRIGGIVATSIFLDKFEDRSKTYTILFGIFLGYSIATLLSVLLFMLGLFMKKSVFLLPFIAINFVETIIGLTGVLISFIFILLMKMWIIFAYFIPCTIIFIGVLFYFWLYILKVYTEFDEVQDLNQEEAKPWFLFTNYKTPLIPKNNSEIVL